MKTRKQRIDYFRENVLPGVRETYETDGRIDGTARREAWNDMIDSFERGGLMTEKQAFNDSGLPNRFDRR